MCIRLTVQKEERVRFVLIWIFTELVVETIRPSKRAFHCSFQSATTGSEISSESLADFDINETFCGAFKFIQFLEHVVCVSMT